MTARGHVENGVVVLDPPGSLPEGAAVEVHLLVDTALLQAGHDAPDADKYADLHPWVRKMSGILPSDTDWEREREAHLWKKYGPW